MVLYYAGAKPLEAAFNFSFQAKKWYHIAVSHSCGGPLSTPMIHLFVNGVLQNSCRFKYPKVAVALALVIPGITLPHSRSARYLWDTPYSIWFCQETVFRSYTKDSELINYLNIKMKCRVSFQSNSARVNLKPISIVLQYMLLHSIIRSLQMEF